MKNLKKRVNRIMYLLILCIVSTINPSITAYSSVTTEVDISKFSTVQECLQSLKGGIEEGTITDDTVKNEYYNKIKILLEKKSPVDISLYLQTLDSFFEKYIDSGSEEDLLEFQIECKYIVSIINNYNSIIMKIVSVVLIILVIVIVVFFVRKRYILPNLNKTSKIN